MAYPTIDKTYGFKPVNRLDGLPYAGAIRQIPIAPSYSTAILNGDTVKVDTNGYIVLLVLPTQVISLVCWLDVLTSTR